MPARVAFAFVLLFVGWGLLAPGSLERGADAAFAFTTRGFSWLYLWMVFGVVVASLGLAFSRYGRLGRGDDGRPASRRRSWVAVLLAAGMGIGLAFRGAAEPLSHSALPPPGTLPGTPEAANAAMLHAFFHWGLHPWAVYSIVALAIAYFQFRRKLPITISATLSGLSRHRRSGWLAAADVLAILATAFGVATSLGLGALQINSGLAEVAGVPVGTGSQVVIIVVTTALFLASAMSGLER